MAKAPQTPAIMWFRQDLRLTDNPALVSIESGRPVIPVYILDDESGRPIGSAARWWLDKSLAALDRDLRAKGSQLVIRHGRAETELPRVAEEADAGHVVWNRLYDPARCERDTRLKTELSERGLDVKSCNGSLLNEPWAVLNGEGEPYKVFTPYWRAARRRLGQPSLSRAERHIAPPDNWPCSVSLEDLRLHPKDPDWSIGFQEWQPGEIGAKAQLARFLDNGLAAYSESRDRPGAEGSSRLSPHLHFGEIGPRQVLRAVETAVESGVPADQAESFLSELGWRDFDHSLLFHHLDIAKTPMRANLDDLTWSNDEAAFRAWTQGQTGYPLIDAGMRQLWQTGWMHNRVRMAVASFLVKHLLIDWRRGEAWFWDTLVDADQANNPANWQWVAGCGADAQPWFRVFNPVLQGEKFDPNGDYVRRFVPELARLPNSRIHQPWSATASELKAAGVKLGDTYPRPVVDHAAARARALAAIRTAA